VRELLFPALNGVQRKGIKSFGISGPDTIDMEVLLLQIPGRLVCNYIQFWHALPKKKSTQ
jgi:hypothetical protein